MQMSGNVGQLENEMKRGKRCAVFSSVAEASEYEEILLTAHGTATAGAISE